MYEYYLINKKLHLGKYKSKTKKIITIADTATFTSTKSTILINSPGYPQDFDHTLEYYLQTPTLKECYSWFTKCISPIDINQFKELYDKYGGICRHIYNSYMYNQNFELNYWDYYTKLVDNVIGNMGINQFLVNYLLSTKLKENVYSNIILTYDFIDDNITTKPSYYLKFISKDIENYVYYKFGFINTLEICNDIINKYYNMIENNKAKHYLLKHILAFYISKNPTIILDHDRYKTDYRYYLSDYSFTYFPQDGSEKIIVINNREECDFIVRQYLIKFLKEDDEIPSEDEKSLKKIYMVCFLFIIIHRKM